MHRRDFLTGALAGLSVFKLQAQTAPFLERARTGLPHKGKVLAAIQPHSDDVALLCAGTVAKLIQEGYTGYMIRATNDDMGDDVGEPGHGRRKRSAQRTRGGRADARAGPEAGFRAQLQQSPHERHLAQRADLPASSSCSAA